MITTYIQRLERIDQLVRLKATGSPKTLAERLGISESMLYRYISDMRCMGAPIAFCQHANSYVYTECVEFVLDFTEISNTLN